MALIADDGVEARAMLVRLALAWTDPFGVSYGPGELVDIDAVTLAELEQLGVVKNMTETPKDAYTGPTGTEPDGYTGPTGGDTDAYTGPTDEPDEEADGYTGPTGGDNT